MSDIRFSNNVRLNASSLAMGIDMNNQLASGSSTYTATQNCWVRVACWGTPASEIYIDGQPYNGGTNGMNYDYFHTFFLSKGSTITYNSSHSWRVFGTK